MRDNEAGRGDSALGAWFAERHVYLRSGTESRYVVLSRSLQIGVTLAVVLVLAGLAVASYSVLGGHIETVEQRREIARLASLVRSLQSAGAIRQDATGTAPNVEVPAAPAPIEGLTARIEQTDAAQRSDAVAAAGTAQALMALPALERHLADAGEQAARLGVQLAGAETAVAALAQGSVPLAQSGSEDTAASPLTQLKADDPDGPLQQLRRQLARAAITFALLHRDLDAAQGALAAERARMPAPAPENAGELGRLRKQLRRAQERIDQLEALADMAAPAAAPAPSPPAPR